MVIAMPEQLAGRLNVASVSVVNTRPVANWDGDWSRASRFYPLHRAQLAALARLVHGINVPVVVCGDFQPAPGAAGVRRPAPRA
jgi:hypothetical protein